MAQTNPYGRTHAPTPKCRCDDYVLLTESGININHLQVSNSSLNMKWTGDGFIGYHIPKKCSVKPILLSQ